MGPFTRQGMSSRSSASSWRLHFRRSRWVTPGGVEALARVAHERDRSYPILAARIERERNDRRARTQALADPLNPHPLAAIVLNSKNAGTGRCSWERGMAVRAAFVGTPSIERRGVKDWKASAAVRRSVVRAINGKHVCIRHSAAQRLRMPLLVNEPAKFFALRWIAEPFVFVFFGLPIQGPPEINSGRKWIVLTLERGGF